MKLKFLFLYSTALASALLFSKAALSQTSSPTATTNADTNAAGTTGTTDTLDPIIFKSTATYGPTVSVITAEDLNHKSYSQVVDILKYEAGLDVLTAGAAGQTTAVFIRGAKSEHTLVLIDGVEVNDATSPSRMYDFANLTTENVERIEIFKGAQTVRFGPDAMGGVINIITKTGPSSAKRTYSVQAGSFGSVNINLGLQNTFKSLRYSLGASAAQTDGFSSADAGPNAERDSWRRFAFSAKADLDLNKDLSLETSVRLSQTDTDLDSGGGVSGDDPNHKSDALVSIVGLKLKYSVNEFINSTLASYLTEHRRNYDNPPDSTNPVSLNDSFNSRTFKINHSYLIDFNSDTQLEALLIFRNESATTDQTFNGVHSLMPKEEQSFFGQALILKQSLNDLKIEIGTRHDHVKYGPSESLWTYTLALEYYLRVFDLKSYINFGTGVKTPSLFQLYSNFGNTDLQSEHARSWDISLEKVFFKKQHFILTYFHQDYERLIDFDSSISRYGNISDAKIQGAELTSIHDIFEGWQLQFSYRYLEALDTNSNTRLLRRPKHLFATHIEWNHSQRSLQLGVRHSASRPDIDPDTFTPVDLASYWVAHLTGSYPLTDHMSLRLRIDNLWDKDYQEIAGYQTPRRSAHIGLSGSF